MLANNSVRRRRVPEQKEPRNIVYNSIDVMTLQKMSAEVSRIEIGITLEVAT